MGHQVVLTASSSEVLHDRANTTVWLPGSDFPGKRQVDPASAPFLLNKVDLRGFPDQALAKRVLEAFLHAADLCRTKEPF